MVRSEGPVHEHIKGTDDRVGKNLLKETLRIFSLTLKSYSLKILNSALILRNLFQKMNLMKFGEIFTQLRVILESMI